MDCTTDLTTGSSKSTPFGTCCKKTTVTVLSDTGPMEFATRGTTKYRLVGSTEVYRTPKDCSTRIFLCSSRYHLGGKSGVIGRYPQSLPQYYPL